MSRRPAQIARKLPRFALGRSRRALNIALDRVETARGGASAVPLPHPPILVLGAPRSGSTLLYQLLIERFRVGYLSNLHCRFSGGPSLVQRLAGAMEPPESSFQSEHGRTRGARAPSECGEYWYRFFRRSPQHVSLEDADDHQLRRLRAAVRALSAAAEAPVVFKNLISSLRVAPIGTALPEALFLVIHRDLLDNAHSLLAARRRIHGDYSAWWSAEPPGIDELRGLPPEEQVVEQIRQIEAVVDRDRAKLGEARFLDVSYEELCSDPRAVLDEVAVFAGRNGARLAPRRQVPSHFPRPARAEIEPELRDRLLAYAARPAGA